MAIKPRPGYDVLGCGATVVSGLGDPDQDPCEMVKILLSRPVRIRFTFYVMADVQAKKTTKNTSGVRFKNYVEAEKLGTVIETQGRHYSEEFKKGYIKVYVWRPAYENKEFQEWCAKNKVVCVNRNVY